MKTKTNMIIMVSLLLNLFLSTPFFAAEQKLTPKKNEGYVLPKTNKEVVQTPNLAIQDTTSGKTIKEKQDTNIDVLCKILLTAGLTGFFSYLASLYSTRKNHIKQLKEKRRGLATTLHYDIESLFALYKRVAKEQLLQSISDKHVPVIELVEPRQNYFSVFDNNITNIGIMDAPIQQKIIGFYGRAKAFYDELLEYSRKLDDYIKFKNDLGFELFRIPGDQLEQMTDDEIARITIGDTAVKQSINYYKATALSLFNNLRNLYLFLVEEDKEIFLLYNEIIKDLTSYINKNS